MSSHPTKRKRSERDFYVTPVEAVIPVVREIRDRWGKVGEPVILDPGAGTGNITAAVRMVWPAAHIVAVEIDPRHEAALRAAGASEVVIGDFLSAPLDGFDLIIGNPPFSLAVEFIERSREHLNPFGIMAMLLQFNFLGGELRVDWWKERPQQAQRTLSPRPSFDGGGNDSVDYAWQVWDEQHQWSWPPFDHYHWRVTEKYRSEQAKKPRALVETIGGVA